MTMIRVLRVVETSQWCEPALLDAHFPDDGREWADAVALTLGLEAGELEVVDSEDDPRTGTPDEWVSDPNVTSEAPPNPDGFIEAARNEYGPEFWFVVAEAAPGIFSLTMTALDKGDWTAARMGTDLLAQREAVTSEQHEWLHASMTAHGIPPTPEAEG